MTMSYLIYIFQDNANYLALAVHGNLHVSSAFSVTTRVPINTDRLAGLFTTSVPHRRPSDSLHTRISVRVPTVEVCSTAGRFPCT